MSAPQSQDSQGPHKAGPLIPLPPCIRFIEKRGVCAWIPDDIPCPNANQSSFTSNWRYCTQAILFSMHQEPWTKVYIMWTLKDAQSTLRLFKNILPYKTWRVIKACRDFNHLLSKPVYVEATNGYPLRHYMELISSRQGRAKGLFVQFYGHRNRSVRVLQEPISQHC